MANHRARFDVAVLAPYAGAHYTGGPVGGAELQSLHLVRELARRGIRVAHLVRAEETTETTEGVAVVPIDRRYELSGVARRRAVVAALQAADARVVVQRSASFETGLAALWARVRRRRFVFSSSSEADFRLDAATRAVAGASLDDAKTRFQYRLGLGLAHRVVVQTETQRRLADAQGITAHVVPSFCDAPAEVSAPRRETFLWVGGLAAVKAPLRYVELARLVPSARFAMLATRRGDEALTRAVEAAAADLPNVALLSPRGRTETLDLYGDAIALVNTSVLEGFPNTFLEAWGRCTPVLSLDVDPDGTIAARGLGVSAGGSLDQLAAAAHRFVDEPGIVERAGAAGRAYVLEVHAPEVVGAHWESLLQELL
jgi:glycosyltransferase involved in cell wall biosynthesis